MKGKGQAKNGDKFFWEKKFHVANGKAQTHTECALHFFLLSLRGGGFRAGYFLVFPSFHYVDHRIIHSLWLAKNGDKFFWEEKFHAANGKAQAHFECALYFFLLSLGGRDLKEDIFQFSLVPTMLTIPPSAHFGWGPQRKGGEVGSSQS